MTVLKYILIMAAGYLLGSVSISIMVSERLFGGDIRTKGSGNAGATNMARVFGMDAGLMTLAADMVKGLASMLLGLLLCESWGVFAAGVAAMIGHCWPVFYHFRGGKGVSVGVAVAVMLGWKVLLLAAVIFFAVAFSTKKVSLSSCSAAVTLAVGALLFRLSLPLVLLAIFTAVIVLVRHRENIRRLLSGTEPDFKPGKRK